MTGRRVPVLLLSAVLLLGPGVAHAHPVVEREPTQAELGAQNQKLDALRAQAENQAGDVRDARAATRAAAVIASQALEAYTTAQRDVRTAQAEEDRLDLELEEANRAAVRARSQVALWARQAYQGGTGLNASPTLNTLLGTNGAGRAEAGLSTTLHTLRRIGQGRSADLSAGRRAELRAERAAVAAVRATEAAFGAANRADAAKTVADAAVARQRRALDDAETELARTGRQVSQAQRQQRRLRAAAEAATRAATGAGNGVTGAVGSCAGAPDLAAYPNGQIPLDALCPLATAPGHHLRADAAYTFDLLSHAYAEQFGSFVCVTDSYREYATQVRLYATKPNLAARPGQSNHGWGTAVDLCGGVQSFGTPEHEWLFANAPLFGWFHPAWAQANGSRPEAWHWEFGG